MPELPEVESVRRGLLASPIDAAIVATWRSDKALRTTGPGTRAQDFVQMHGGHLGELQRRGKYLLWAIEVPKRSRLGLLIHLGMSGRCGVTESATPRIAHTHLVIGLANGFDIRLVDPRRFGAAVIGDYSQLQNSAPLCDLGPEPLDDGIDLHAIVERVKSLQRPIRDALLDQTLLAGVGNIYACEALHAVGIHPLQPANSLRLDEWTKTLAALREVLLRGIENGGTTLKDFRNVSGEVGRNQDDLRVYGRTGEACFLCGHLIAHGTSNGRSYFYCLHHQSLRAANVTKLGSPRKASTITGRKTTAT